MTEDRAIHVQEHDDGVNAWRNARVPAPLQLRDEIYGYSDYWERTGGFTTRRELPHAEGVLIFNLGAPIAITGGDGGVVQLSAGEAFVAGAHLRPALSHSDGGQAGVHVFLPLATLRRLTGTPMDRLVDRVVPLDALLGAKARDLGAKLCEAKDRGERVALLDAALGRRLSQTPPLALQQTHALQLLRTRPDRDIADIAHDIGWSRKHLASCVKDMIGIGPRCFRRLLRFQTLTAMINRRAGPSDWAGLALDAGYYDQPHMVREFREFSGMTPGPMAVVSSKPEVRFVQYAAMAWDLSSKRTFQEKSHAPRDYRQPSLRRRAARDRISLRGVRFRAPCRFSERTRPGHCRPRAADLE